MNNTEKEDQDKIVKYLMNQSKGLLEITDFLPLMESLAPDLKPEIISKLGSHSIDLQTKKLEIEENYKFVQLVKFDITKFSEKQSVSKLKYSFPCGCEFSSKSSMTKSLELLNLKSSKFSINSDCPICGFLAAQSALEPILINGEF